MHMVKGHERKIIAYPIREGAIMNLVALIREFVPQVLRRAIPHSVG
jgi:hypothetical protein